MDRNRILILFYLEVYFLIILEGGQKKGTPDLCGLENIFVENLPSRKKKQKSHQLPQLFLALDRTKRALRGRNPPYVGSIKASVGRQDFHHRVAPRGSHWCQIVRLRYCPLLPYTELSHLDPFLRLLPIQQIDQNHLKAYRRVELRDEIF